MAKAEMERRIGIANLALDTFIPGVLLYRTHELRMCWDIQKSSVPQYDFPARLRSDGSWTQFGYRHRPTGGTGMQALAQLIRFVRDLPRLPISTWEYWAAERVGLCTSRTVELLRGGNYADPKKTCCIYCGDEQFIRGLDWWSLHGRTGPACRHDCPGLADLEQAQKAEVH